MNRIKELSHQYLKGDLSPTAYRSALVAQLSMAGDALMMEIAVILTMLGSVKRRKRNKTEFDRRGSNGGP